MPGSLKIKIMSARNLPVMDRASDLTDAFVEVRIGNDNFKTDVYKKSLNPFWNTDWFTFELDDQQLQEEILQIRVLDHDTYSAHDSIGKVYINLDTLLIRKKNRIMTGWFPIYDTMHGIQGEINLSLRLDLFSDVSKFRQSSIGVKFFFSNCIPEGFIMTRLLGFVEELIIMDDPEHEWREKIRTSRATNESRQRLFSKLTGEIQRKIGVKVLEEGGNAVVGFQVYFDLEGETGVVIRSIGTVIQLEERDIPLPESASPPQTTPTAIINNIDFNASLNSIKPDLKEIDTSRLKNTIIPNIIKQKNIDLGELPLLTISQVPVGFIESLGSIVSVKSVKLLEKTHSEDRECRDAWWLELRREMASHMRSINCSAVIGYTESCVITEDVCILCGCGTGVVLNKQFYNQTENDNNAQSNGVYLQDNQPVTFSCLPRSSSPPPAQQISSKFSVTNIKDNSFIQGCRMCHTISSSQDPSAVPSIPNSSNSTNNIGSTSLPNSACTNGYVDTKKQPTICDVCGKFQVPEVIFSTTEIPEELEIRGQTALIQARVCRTKRESKGEQCAKEINELLPFLEYDVHYKLIHNLFLKGLNAIFGLKIRLSVGHNIVVAIATGTGIFLSALPSPIIPRLQTYNMEEEKIVSEMIKFQNTCSKILQLNKSQTPPPNIQQRFMLDRSKHLSVPSRSYHRSVSDSSDIVSRQSSSCVGTSIAQNGSNSENTYVDTSHLDINFINSIIREGLLPENISMETVNSNGFCNNINSNMNNCDVSSRMLIRFVRTAPLLSTNSSSIGGGHNNSAEISIDDVSIPEYISSTGAGIGGSTNVNLNTNSLLADKLDLILQQFNSSLWFKLRRSLPISIIAVDYRICVTEDNNLEILFSGFLSNNSMKKINKGIVENTSDAQLPVKHKISVSSNASSIRQSCFLFCPLSSIPGFQIEQYLGSLNFFFVRETTYLREFKGASGFMQACIGEVQSVVAAHTQAAGGNALMSCAITELVLDCGSAGHSAQVLLNIRGDMVYGI